MFNNPLFRQHQTLVALGILALVLMIVVFFFVLPWLQHSAQLGQRIQGGYEQLARYRQVATTRPELLSEYQRVQQQGLDKLFYPPGMTAAQVGKELQKQLANVVSEGNGVLVSSEVVETPPVARAEEDIVIPTQKGYQQVVVKALFQGNPALLRELLHQAYRARPLLFVESIDVRLMEQDDSKGQLLKADVQISTYWRGNDAVHENLD